jgi:localization factor PodJL
LFGVSGVAAACLIAALIVYSRDETPSEAQLAQLQPQHGAATALVPAAPEASSLLMGAPAPSAPMLASAPSEAAPAASPAVPQATTATPSPPLVLPPVPPSSVAASIPTPAPPAATFGPAEAHSASYADAGPAAPAWEPDHKPAPRKPPTPRHPALSNVLALRNDGYDQLLRRRYAEAISLFQQATAMGDAYAPMYIGQIFEYGLGVARNVGQASFWYGVAINRGNAAALSAFNRMRMNPY